MLKAKEYKIADSNIELFGSDLEKQIKKAAALCDPEWKSIAEGKPVIGLKVWRVEKFAVKKWAAVGQFHTGDSYIVLNTYKANDKFLYDIHFWLGAETTQDEAGTAAYKTVELDDSLGQVPIQHREVQDHESSMFVSYFKDKGGIRILEGGIDSGFNHVKAKEYRPRLLHIRGRKIVRVCEVPMSHKFLNSNDVFVLDAGLKLYQWQGQKCSPAERMKAASLVQAIDDERGGKPERITLSETDTDKDPNVGDFWKLIGGKGPIAPDVPDDKWEDGHDGILYRCSDKTGKLVVTEEAKGKIPLSKLDTNDVFVLDVGCEVFVWVGKKCSVKERQQGMNQAIQFLKSKGLKTWVPITRILEGGENEIFKTFLAGEKRKF